MGTDTKLSLEIWSYNYLPEPTGIAPVTATLAEELMRRGHRVEVVAAHPHYPSAHWGTAWTPYREERDGVPVLRLPLWIGRETSGARMRQELSFALASFGALPALSTPDLMLVVSPSFPALLPALVNARIRRMPWVLWLHDILPDGAEATGLVEPGPTLRAARWLERTAYREADRIIVLSDAFVDNLSAKGVLTAKIERIYDPATRPIREGWSGGQRDETRILSMGNIGLSQGLAPLVAAFERSSQMAEMGVEFMITGDGVAADGVRAEIKSDRVHMPGLVDDDRLEEELNRATIAFVSQHYEGGEFNIPSKLMNFMGYGLPVLAAVNPRSEVARIVEASGGGWVVDGSHPDDFPPKVAQILQDREGIEQRAKAAHDFARQHFSRQGFADFFERSLTEVATSSSRTAN